MVPLIAPARSAGLLTLRTTLAQVKNGLVFRSRPMVVAGP